MRLYFQIILVFFAVCMLLLEVIRSSSTVTSPLLTAAFPFLHTSDRYFPTLTWHFLRYHAETGVWQGSLLP